MQKKNRDEERVFSVTMTEEEVALFSEFLEQREYARSDYNGLTSMSRKNLNRARNVQARKLKAARKVVNDLSGYKREEVLNRSKEKARHLREVALDESRIHRNADSYNGENKFLKSKFGKAVGKRIVSTQLYHSPLAKFIKG